MASLPPPTPALTAASTPPLGLAERPEPVSVRAKGAGELRLARRYPLGDLVYTADPSGRGMLTFSLGRGVLVLSGVDAKEITRRRYVLHLDVLQVHTMAQVSGDCTLTLSSAGRVYRTLTCSGLILADGERFQLVWRGLDLPAEPLR